MAEREARSSVKRSKQGNVYSIQSHINDQSRQVDNSSAFIAIYRHIVNTHVWAGKSATGYGLTETLKRCILKIIFVCSSNMDNQDWINTWHFIHSLMYRWQSVATYYSTALEYYIQAMNRISIPGPCTSSKAMGQSLLFCSPPTSHPKLSVKIGLS